MGSTAGYGLYGWSGLSGAAGQIVPGAVSSVGGALTPAIATSIWGTTAPLWAVPVVGAAIAGITIGLTLILNRKGPRQKEIASQDADQVERLLQQGVQAYLADPTAANQAAQIANFNAAWAWLVSADGCGNPDLGDAGRRCIAERQRGGSAPWCPTGTGCDWFTDYLDPIVNTPPVQTSALDAGGFSLGGSLPSLGGGGLLVGFGLVVGGLLLAGVFE